MNDMEQERIRDGLSQHTDDRRERRREDRHSDRNRREDKRQQHEHRSTRKDPDRRHSHRYQSRSRSRSPDRRKHHHSSHHSHERRKYDNDESSSSSESHDTRRERRRQEKRRQRKDKNEEVDSEDERRRRRKRHETSEERRERRERRKEKESRRQRKGGAIMEYGKHGIISETDVTSRLTSEFRQWLVEERHINPETISRATEKKEMSSFIEEYNTATMPSEKYYNLEAHERRMAMIRAGETVEEDGGYDPLADEKAAKASYKAQRRKEENSKNTPTQWQSKEQLEALRRVQMERIEAAKMKQLGLQTSANMGVRMDGTEFDRR